MPKFIFSRFSALIKPQYILRPRQAIRRIAIEMASTTPRPSAATIRLPWGLEVEVDPRENIGLALYTQGIYELNGQPVANLSIRNRRILQIRPKAILTDILSIFGFIRTKCLNIP